MQLAFPLLMALAMACPSVPREEEEREEEEREEERLSELLERCRRRELTQLSASDPLPTKNTSELLHPMRLATLSLPYFTAALDGLPKA